MTSLVDTIVLTHNDLINYKEYECILYPNPSKNFISIKTDLNYSRYQIIDIQNRLVLQAIISDLISIQNLKQGMYCIQLLNNSEILEKKIFLVE